MSFNYNEFTDRNIGLLTDAEQQMLKNSHVAVFGVGGLGGVIAEVLVRTGVGTITIVDKDVFDSSNMNRQIFAFTDTIGKKKVDVTEDYLKKINPELSVNKYITVEKRNVNQAMQGVNIALLALDDIVPCILIARYAHAFNIPVVEGWAIPFGNVRVFTSETPTLEEVYGMPTIGKDVSLITNEERKQLNLQMLFTLQSIQGIKDYYSEFALNRIANGKITSFAPMVWLTAVLMANESLKIILNKGDIALSPEFKVYDPYKNQIPKQGCE